MSAAIPDTLEDVLSPEWLSAALGREVTGVTLGSIINRVSTNAPVHVECAEGEPVDLWVKGYFNDVGRPFRHAGVPEALFYRELASSAGIRTLRSLYADVDTKTFANVLLTEDVLGQGATFLDALSAYTPDQTAESLGELAKLHASTWMHADCAKAPWLESRLPQYTVNRGIDDIRLNFEGPIGAGVPDAVRDSQRLYDGYKALASMIPAATPWSVIHGDPHVGNVFLDGDGRPSFVDWQLVQRGPWYLDVGYHLASALTVEDRRRSESDLVEHYLDRLTSYGVERPSEDEVRVGIGRGMLHGFYLWGITLKVDPAITTELLIRLGTATDDHGALDEVAPR